MSFTLGTLAAQPAIPFEFDETRHAALFGATRSGKSTALANIAIQQMRAGGPLFIWDPHGTLIQDLLWYVPRDRLQDVIIFDPKDEEKQIGFNPLTHGDEVAALDLIEILASYGGENSFMARSRDIATNFILAAIHTLPHPTPFDLALMFRSEEYAKQIFEACPEPIYADWGKKHFGKKDRDREEIEAAPANKANALITLTILRDIFSQEEGLDFDECIAKNKIVFFNLRKGEIGAEAANVLGSVALRMLLAAVLRRKPHTGKQCLALVDEAHTFTKLGNAIDEFLSETAKFNTTFILGNQIFAEFTESARREIFANVSTLIILRVSAEDAEVLGKELRMEEPKALISLSTGELWAKLVFPHLVKVAQHAFTLRWYFSKDRKQKFPQFVLAKRGDEAKPREVLAYSHENNGVRRAVIHAAINKRRLAASI
jgi:DNA helicase HerA-like ATPase